MTTTFFCFWLVGWFVHLESESCWTLLGLGWSEKMVRDRTKDKRRTRSDRVRCAALRAAELVIVFPFNLCSHEPHFYLIVLVYYTLTRLLFLWITLRL